MAVTTQLVNVVPGPEDKYPGSLSTCPTEKPPKGEVRQTEENRGKTGSTHAYLHREGKDKDMHIPQNREKRERQRQSMWAKEERERDLKIESRETDTHGMGGGTERGR